MGYKMKKPSPLKGFFGDVMAGKGVAGALLNPVGAIGNKTGLFYGKEKKTPLEMCGCGKKSCSSCK
jgi:hypothetical protein